jgi:endonuclease/exonuclease/phosphatase family metal-dependent hydrolase
VSILEVIEQLVPSHADLVMGGDFNFVSLGDRKKSEGLKTTSAEREALARFARLGLVSCWATTHPGRALAQTLRWSGDSTPDKSTPYHCDGIFVPTSWDSRIICEVLTSACFEVSDHYPIAAWISR